MMLLKNIGDRRRSPALGCGWLFGSDARSKTGDVLILSVVVDGKSDWQKAANQMPDLAKAITVFDKGGAYSQNIGMTLTASLRTPAPPPATVYPSRQKG